ncbi:MAG: helix-turn-helix transcriptional regulator [Pseudomonadota bacterium]
MAHWRTFLDGEAQAGRYMPWREVARTTGLSRTTAWRLQKRDDFPAPYAISPGRAGYREDEVRAWCVSRDPSAARARPASEARREDSPVPARAEPAGGALQEAAKAREPWSRAAQGRRRRSQHAQAIAQQMLFDF